MLSPSRLKIFCEMTFLAGKDPTFFPRRQRPDVFENVPTTVVGHRCAFCRQLLPNTNAVSLHHSADETIQHRNVQGTVLFFFFFLNLQLVHVSCKHALFGCIDT